MNRIPQAVFILEEKGIIKVYFMFILVLREKVTCSSNILKIVYSFTRCF